MLTARPVLRELLRLADQAPALTDQQLRFRLVALAECAVPHPGVPSSSPAGRWSSAAPTPLSAVSRPHQAGGGASVSGRGS
ncbi:MAG: hypothetical protein ACRDRX_25745 [Pseudonocardiaceae bacterium]